MQEDEKQFAGDELDDTPEESPAEGPETASKKEPSKIVTAKTSGRNRIIVFGAVLGICVVIFISYIAWNRFIPEKKNNPTVVRVPVEQERLLDLNAFVIPHKENNNNYISFSVSLKIKQHVSTNEMEKNREYLRGKIYDLLKAYLDQQIQIPPPEAIKDIIENGVNEAFPAGEGKIGGVYITRFLVI